MAGAQRGPETGPGTGATLRPDPRPAAAPALAARGLVRRFGALAAIDGVDLDLRPGEVHGLIGPNGAGKSTLIALLAGALAADAGAITLAGRQVGALPARARARLGLARTFQTPSVFPELTARRNVMLAAQALAQPASPFRRADSLSLAATAEAALAEVGLADRADVPAAALSHGERRGLELAMALVRRPAVLLLDEPMAGAGRAEAARLTETLAALKGRVAMLLVEHDMAAVFALADRLSVLVAGRVIASGAPEAVRADPAVQAAYLGRDG